MSDAEWEELAAAAEDAVKRGDHDEAEKLYAVAVERAASFGPGDRRLLETLGALAGLLRYRDKFEQAEPVYRRWLSVAEKTIGLSNPDLESCLNVLATFRLEQGRFGEARSLFDRAVGILEKAFSSEPVVLAARLRDVASIYDHQGTRAKIKLIEKKALARLKGAKAPDRDEISRRSFDMARITYRRILELQEENLGADHPAVAATLNELARVSGELGDYADAESLRTRAVAILKSMSGSGGAAEAGVIRDQALDYWKAGRYSDSADYFRRVMENWRKAFDEDDPKLPITMMTYANVLKKLGCESEAAEWEARANEIGARQGSGRCAE